VNVRITRPHFVQPTCVWACNLIWVDRPGPTNGPLMMVCTAYGETEAEAVKRAESFAAAFVKLEGGAE